MSDADDPAVTSRSPDRTVCHGCRQLTLFLDDWGDIRPVIIPGVGIEIREKDPGIVVDTPCRVCAYSVARGWIAGFEPPV